MQRVLVLDKERKPLMPCRPSRARELLEKGKAAVFRRYPFTIILKDRVGGETQPIAFKIDPGSKTTGLVMVADFKRGKVVVWAAELSHRGQRIVKALMTRRDLRRNRRSRKCRYRATRFLNRTRKPGWLPPSLESRISNIMTWFSRMQRWSPVSSISLELTKFDTQKMQNPEISGVEYQQGELQGYEVREYLLEKWGHKCAYCGAKNVPLQVEHINPRSRGGSDRVSNLTLACADCNDKKKAKTAAEFGYPKIQAQAKQPLKDAAAVNSTRKELLRRLEATGLIVECGTGAQTKFNRIKQGYPKEHWIDAACIGESGSDIDISNVLFLCVASCGSGKRQKCILDAFGFPKIHTKRAKEFCGWQTGDIAKVSILAGKYNGVSVGRIAIRHKMRFRIGLADVHPKYLHRIHRSDGYNYIV